MTNPIRVFFSPLSRRFYATQHYTEDNGIVTVTGAQFDVTNDIGALIETHGAPVKRDDTPNASKENSDDQLERPISVEDRLTLELAYMRARDWPSSEMAKSILGKGFYIDFSKNKESHP